MQPGKRKGVRFYVFGVKWGDFRWLGANRQQVPRLPFGMTILFNWRSRHFEHRPIDNRYIAQSKKGLHSTYVKTSVDEGAPLFCRSPSLQKLQQVYLRLSR
jgi:hypothetical protein